MAKEKNRHLEVVYGMLHQNIYSFFIISSFQSSALSGNMSLFGSDEGHLFHSQSHHLSKETATKPRGNLEISNNSKGSKNVRVIVRLRNNLNLYCVYGYRTKVDLYHISDDSWDEGSINQQFSLWNI